MSEQELPATGHQVIDSAEKYGVKHLFTLSGAHIFPLYDACEKRPNAPALVDTRSEQTAGFAAEATARLTRTPGFVAATAGPGVTNLVTPITSAFFNGAPVVAIGGRSPDFRWGLGALQELDHPPLFESVTKSALTAHDSEQVGHLTQQAFATALSPHQGPTFLDIPMDKLFTPAPVTGEHLADVKRPTPDLAHLDEALRVLNSSHRPVFIAGGDIWQNKVEEQFQNLIEQIKIPVIVNGMARGILPPSDPLLVTPARSHALKNADVVVVAGTPLDFRLGYGDFGDAQVIFVSDDPLASRQAKAIRLTGDLLELVGILSTNLTKPIGTQSWKDELHARSSVIRLSNQELMRTRGDLIHPAEIYGELIPRLTQSTITIGDGGDFVSFAGKFIEPERPGRWLDPGPFGALGTAMGYTLAAGKAFPSDPLVVLLGDGAAGFSLMDVDSLVRHKIPATIIVGNNAGWGLERHPMRFLYGYDVLADLEPSRYDQVVEALGGAGEVVESIWELGPALDRAMNSGVPYLVNVMTDPEVAYPRTTTGI
ncbi:MAG: acetolactate synthase [Actinomycetia bacterium]|nr:acetolactate synthase [Actinomycetes bacterium]